MYFQQVVLFNFIQCVLVILYFYCGMSVLFSFSLHKSFMFSCMKEQDFFVLVKLLNQLFLLYFSIMFSVLFNFVFLHWSRVLTIQFRLWLNFYVPMYVCLCVYVCTFAPLQVFSCFFYLFIFLFLLFISSVSAFCKECSCGNLLVFCVVGYYFVDVVGVVKSMCVFCIL